MTIKARRCPGCGGRCKADYIMCQYCWRRVPKLIRFQFRIAQEFGSLPRIREAVRAAIESVRKSG